MHLESQGYSCCCRMLLLALVIVVVLLLCGQAAQAQTYTVLHNFGDGLDGSFPYGGLTMDAVGNLYGTTCGALCAGGGANSMGTVFRLSNRGGGWVFTPLYVFRVGNDGAGPSGRVVFGPDGALYGTTYQGGSSGGGTVFKLTPPATVSPSATAGWTETVLYSFQGGDDGAGPELGDVVFDSAGNLYGTTAYGGPANQGTVFQLKPAGSGWTETVIHAFNGSDGSSPLGTLAFGSYGSLTGTTMNGNNVFQLMPSGSNWNFSTVYQLGDTDGQHPIAGVMDGGIVSTTSGGTHGGGTVFMLHNDMFHVNLTGGQDYPYSGPWATPTGNSFNMYGTTFADGAYQYGSVFNLYGCAGWGYTSLHDFAGPDGAYPAAGVALDASGHIFGTTSHGGSYGDGVVFEITLDAQHPPECAEH